MWQAQVQASDASRAQRIQIASRGGILSYADVIELWAEKADFRSFYSAFLAEVDFAAYFWELPPATQESIHNPFEFVLIPSQALANLEPDPGAFTEKFSKQPQTAVLIFPNLGGDAVLVVPSSRTSFDAYPHLAAFVRQAPDEQQHALWEAVSRAMRLNLPKRQIWLSTAGFGVPWLHLRLDSSPKYYRHEPYKIPI